MSNGSDRFWDEVVIGQTLGMKEYELTWEEQEVRLDALDNSHAWFRELSPWVGRLMDPFVLIRLAPQLVREAFPHRGGGVYSKYEVTLSKPVFAEDRITVTGLVADKYEKRGGKYVNFEVTFLDSLGDQVMKTNFHTLTNVAEVRAARREAQDS